jgi:hypothetical protein
MRSIRFEAFTRSAPNALEDVALAAAILAGAASKAESELARKTGPTRAELAVAGPLQKIIRSCNEFERAVARAQDLLETATWANAMAADDQPTDTRSN